MTREPNGQLEVEHATPRKRFGLLQWNLSTLFLLTAAIAVWAGFMRYTQSISELSRQIDVMKQFAADPLKHKDSQRILVRNVQDYWSDRRAWDVYLPDDEYAVRLATHDIVESGLAPFAFESPVKGGWHRVELQAVDFEPRPRYLVLVDGQQVIHVLEEPERGPRNGFGHEFCNGTEESDRPLVLLRKVFHWPHEDEGRANGILLWIERVRPERAEDNQEAPATE
jgi:hypothetical protein